MKISVRFVSGRHEEVELGEQDILSSLFENVAAQAGARVKLFHKGRELVPSRRACDVPIVAGDVVTALEMRRRRAAPTEHHAQRPAMPQGQSAPAPADFLSDLLVEAQAAADLLKIPEGPAVAPMGDDEGGAPPGRKRRAQAQGSGEKARAPTAKRRKDRAETEGAIEEVVAEDLAHEAGPATDAVLNVTAVSVFGKPLSVALGLLADALPLPPCLEPVLKAFNAFDRVYAFLARQHIQATWANCASAAQEILGAPPSLAHLKAASTLAPHLLFLREGAVIGARDAGEGEGGDYGPPDASDPTPDAEALDFASAGGFLPTSTGAVGVRAEGVVRPGPRTTSLILEFVDPGRRAPAAVSTDQIAGESASGLDAMSGLGAGAPAGRRAPDLQSERAAKTASERRQRAFRHACAVATGLALEGADPTQTLGKALRAGHYPDSLPLPDLTLEAISAAASAQRRPWQASADLPDKLRSPAKAPRGLMVARHTEPCASTEPLAVPAFLEHLRNLSWYAGQCVHERELPGRTAARAAPATPLRDSTVRALRAVKNLTPADLFSHQAQAIDALLAGRHTIVATPTASGKSLCYNVPVLEALAADPKATALYMFPTKALAQDQLRALRELLGAAFGPTVAADDPVQASRPSPSSLPLPEAVPANPLADCLGSLVAVYDGDTAQCDRPHIRETAQILITNPDMLSLSLLPIHAGFRRFLSNLKYIVVDEGHAYRGVFGCHTALVLRRLVRLCARVYDTRPVFVVTSATMANTRAHVGELIGVPPGDLVLVDQDGSPTGGKTFVLWNPPLNTFAQGQGRAAVDKGKEKKGAAGRQDGPNESDADTVKEEAAEEGEGEGEGEGDTVALSTTELRARSNRRRNVLREKNQSRGGAVRLGCGEGGEEEWLRDVRAAKGAAPLVPGAALSTIPGLKAQPEEPPAPNAPSPLPLPPPGTPRALIRRGPRTGTSVVTAEDLRAAQARLPPPGDWRQRGREGMQGRAGGSGSDPRRTSPIVEISLLLMECLRHGLRTIAFCKTRKVCELVTSYVRETLRSAHPELAEAISVYRAGYAAEARRAIERDLFTGKIRAVAATNALELGVDVGHLDCTLHLGFPGTVASLWQQAGRAGRRGQQSLAIYVAFDGPLDQYFFRSPEALFGRPIEGCFLDAANPKVLELHACCAAQELPLHAESDQEFFGARLPAVVRSLRSARLLCPDPATPAAQGFLRYCGPAVNPATDFSLRAIDPGRFKIVDKLSGNVIEEIEDSKAFYEAFEGAVVMHQGKQYLCHRLDLTSKVAWVQRADLKYFTRIRDMTDVHVLGGSLAYETPGWGGSAADGNASHAVCCGAKPEGAADPDPEARAIEEGKPNSELTEIHPAAPENESDRDPPLPPTCSSCSPCLVTTRWLGFFRILHGSGAILDAVDVHLPDVSYETQACYVRVPHVVRHELRALGLPFRDSVHAASHAVLNVLPLLLGGVGGADMGTECDNPFDTRYRPERILLFDKHPGGIGLAQQAAPRFGALLARALALVQQCACRHGCPGCVQHTDCSEYNAVLHKQGAAVVLRRVMEADARALQLAGQA